MTDPTRKTSDAYEGLKEAFYYNEVTGDFTRKVKAGRHLVGSKAGTRTKKGYNQLHFNKRSFLANRVTYYFMTGELPEVVDHKNRDRGNDSFSNLRAATQMENCRNRTAMKGCLSKYKGVLYSKATKQRKKPWYVQIRIEGKRHHVGTYATEIEARDAYRERAKIEFGEFYTDG